MPAHNPQDKPKININSVTDLIAAVPLMFRFQPIDSFVVFPLTPGMPFARIDHPHDSAALLDMAASFGATYRRPRRTRGARGLPTTRPTPWPPWPP